MLCILPSAFLITEDSKLNKKPEEVMGQVEGHLGEDGKLKARLCEGEGEDSTELLLPPKRILSYYLFS